VDLFLAHPISLYHDFNLWRLTKGQATTARAGFLLCNLLIPPQRGQAKPLCKVGGFTIAIAD